MLTRSVERQTAPEIASSAALVKWNFEHLFDFARPADFPSVRELRAYLSAPPAVLVPEAGPLNEAFGAFEADARALSEQSDLLMRAPAEVAHAIFGGLPAFHTDLLIAPQALTFILHADDFAGLTREPPWVKGLFDVAVKLPAFERRVILINGGSGFETAGREEIEQRIRHEGVHLVGSRFYGGRTVTLWDGFIKGETDVRELSTARAVIAELDRLVRRDCWEELIAHRAASGVIPPEQVFRISRFDRASALFDRAGISGDELAALQSELAERKSAVLRDARNYREWVKNRLGANERRSNDWYAELAGAILNPMIGAV